MSERWIADRMHQIDASGIRKVFDLAANMPAPVNLSIGQPHFDTDDSIKEALFQAVRDGKNAYSQTQGIAPLRARLEQRIQAELGHADREVFVSSGTSGGLMLALSTLVNPGDEVIVFDPFFVMYRHLTAMSGGRVVLIDSYPEFRIDVNQVREAITDRTKVILFNSPGNPTGAVASRQELEDLAKLAREKDVALISDEIYRSFCYDEEFVSPARWNDQTIVIDGLSKSHSMTGWRLGFVHGPAHVMQQMIKLQQFTFVCAPHPVQWAGLSALDYDVTPYVDEYRGKRDFMLSELGGDYEIHGADGAFYLFVKTPWGTGTEFVTRAIENNLLIIPGVVFSSVDSHFRISYAAPQETLQQGVEILKKMLRR